MNLYQDYKIKFTSMQPMSEEELEVISTILDQALEHGLEVETIYWALKAMQQTPTMKPSEAMALGILEWVK
jgi:hypothetical protein